MKILLVLLFVLPMACLGQRNSFSLGGEIAFPNGTFKTNSNTGYGGSFRYERALTGHLAGMATVGYLTFSQKHYAVNNSNSMVTARTSIVPLQLGLKYYLFHAESRQTGLFLTGEVGYHTFYTNATYKGSKVNVPNDHSFSYAPGVGCRIGRLDVSYRHQFLRSSGTTTIYSGVRIAFLF